MYHFLSQCFLFASFAFTMAIKINKVYPGTVNIQKKKTLHNCIVCSLKLPLIFGCLNGFNAVGFSCPHANSTTHSTKFYISKYKILMACSLTSLTLYQFFVDLIKMKSLDVSNIFFLIIFSESVFCISDVLMKTICLTIIERRLNLLQYYQAIVDNRYHYGIETILNQRDIKLSRSNQKTTMYFICCSMILYTVTVYCLFHDKGLQYVRLLTDLLATYSQLTAVAQISFEIRIFNTFLSTCYCQIRKIATAKPKNTSKDKLDFRSGTPLVFSVSHASKDVDLLPETRSIEKGLRKCQELYSDVLLCVKEFNKLLWMVFVISFVSLLLQLIINCFVILKSYFGMSYVRPETLLSFMKICINSGFTLTNIFDAEELLVNVSTYHKIVLFGSSGISCLM